MGIDLGPFFAEIHRTNMEKAGGPVRPSDGKILKPPGWKPPDIVGMLAELLDRPVPEDP
jgi:predicted HAD superfamily Cof-like phosphohydrolase